MPDRSIAIHPTIRLRLLIAEDELMVAWTLVEMVHELGHKVCATVATQDEAIEAVGRHKPDSVFMDYRLAAGGDGLVAARRIREATDVPIIFCTAYGPGLRTELQALPRTLLVLKPVRMQDLREALDWAGDLRRAGCEVAQTSESLS